MPTIPGHLLAAVVVLVMPLWSRRAYRTARRRIDHGAPGARAALYRRVLLTQTMMTAAVAGVWAAGHAPAARFGLRPPASWPIAAALTAGILGLFAWSALRLRRRAPMLREKLRERAGALLPDSASDLRWYALISLGSGAAEELLYRGFFFAYLAAHVPSLDAVALVLTTAAIFGMAHLYQGWRGIVATGIAGVALGALYVVTGTVFVPMILHSAGNLRGIALFAPRAAASPSIVQ